MFARFAFVEDRDDDPSENAAVDAPAAAVVDTTAEAAPSHAAEALDVY